VPTEPAPTPTADAPDRSRGPVTEIDWLDFRTLTPVPGGLFCPVLFGPPHAWDPDAWAHIDLGVPVLAPEVIRGRPSPAAVALGVSQRAVDRRVRLDPEGLLADLEAIRRSVPPTPSRHARGTGPRSARGRAAALAFLAERPVSLDRLPVVPADRRPYRITGTRVALHTLNEDYRRVLLRAQRLRRLEEVQAPQAVLLRERRLLQERVEQALAAIPAPTAGTGAG
jgi:DNA-directed RNA polymerase beta' subunit